MISNVVEAGKPTTPCERHKFAETYPLPKGGVGTPGESPSHCHFLVHLPGKWSTISWRVGKEDDILPSSQPLLAFLFSEIT